MGVSGFCCVYLIAFAHLANPTMSRDWLVSSSISILIDLVAFEVLPAFAVGVLGILFFGCKARCLLWILASIEIYRFVRNLIDT